MIVYYFTAYAFLWLGGWQLLPPHRPFSGAQIYHPDS